MVRSKNVILPFPWCTHVNSAKIPEIRPRAAQGVVHLLLWRRRQWSKSMDDLTTLNPFLQKGLRMHKET